MDVHVKVTLQNQTSTDTLYMRNYDVMKCAVPGQDACGLAIYIDYNIQNNIQETKAPIECTRGTDNRAITLTKNGVLYLRTRIIDGSFSSGYCIQIYRQHATGDAFRLQLHCIRDLTIPSGTNITKYKESVPELQIAQLLSVPDPYPDITQRATIADMCTTDFAYEEPINGGVTVDSVALRVMTRQDGCTCEVSLENHYNSYSVFMRKYDLLTSAAPQQKVCGLAIDIDYTSADIFKENKDSIECTQGTYARSIPFLPNGVLYFRSRIIDGDFSRGYCIQIFRQHTTGDNVDIHINCSLPNMQTTQHDKNDSSNIQTTQQMTDVAIHHSTVSENENVRIVITIVAVIGWCLAVLFAITTVCLYRRINKQRPNSSGEPHVNAQYQNLHVTRLSSCYSSLNASAFHSEQHEHI